MIRIDPQALKLGLSSPKQVSRGLNLVLELRDRRDMPELLAKLLLKGREVREALDSLHFVHFARFLPLRDQSALLVITEFDGPLDPYALDFVIAIGETFDTILEYVRDSPPLPVRDHPREFMRFVKKNDQVFIAPNIPYPGDYPVYSAYPQKTVVDIVGPRQKLAPSALPPTPAGVERSDIQGNILEGYNADTARHYALRIEDPGVGREFLRLVVDGDGSECPVVTTARRWSVRPLYFLNIGFTADGLKAVGVPRHIREQLPEAFTEGPAQQARAEKNGDTGASSPTQWELGMPGQPVHIVVSLYGDDDHPTKADEFQMRWSQLEAWWRKSGIKVVSLHKTHALPENQVHFGYREGMAQSHIAGVTNSRSEDNQPHASVGEFLLGKDYESVYRGNALQGLPPSLCENGTFAAVRILEQDVAGFERLLDETSGQTGLDRELIAAKLMGRWRDGTPLSDVALAQQGPQGHSKPDYNSFYYAPSLDHPGVADDHEGLKCPVGAHIRRMNPRNALVAGAPFSHRIVRRGMPYGEQLGKGDFRQPRGLFGMFICADLERQFEFLQQEWANGDIAASGIRGTQDPVAGEQNLDGEFILPVEGRAEPIRLRIPRLVTTRGSLYLLMPGFSALRYLASGEGFEEPTPERIAAVSPMRLGGATTLQFHPKNFDPKNPKFLANPYPFYTEFRNHAPVALVKKREYESYWVFSHKLITQVCEDIATFLKEPIGKEGARGLFYMDPPRHTQVRQMLDPMLKTEIAPIAQFTVDEASAAIEDIRLSGNRFELVKTFSNRVTRNSFMRMFGLPQKDWDEVGATVDLVLKHFDQMLPTWERAPAALASGALYAYFSLRRLGCPAHSPSPELFCKMAREGQLESAEVVQTAIHFALGGYLSTDFLVSSGIHNLVSRPPLLREFRSTDRVGRSRFVAEMARFDAPFQMADRFAARDTILDGVEIPAGARVTVVYGSANRDDRVFGVDADEFNPNRIISPGENYVFGHGIHHCIGAEMASTVAPAAIGTIIDSMPGLAMTSDTPQRYQDPYFRAFSRLFLTA